MANASGKLFDAKPLTGFLFLPTEVCIIGHDTAHKLGEHPLVDERTKLPIDPAQVKVIIRAGCRRTIRVRKEAVSPNRKLMSPELLALLEREGGFAPVAMDGRTMVLAARKANEEIAAAMRKEGATDAEVDARLVRIECRAEKVSDDMAMGIMILANSYHREDDVFTKASKAARFAGLGKTPEEVGTMFGVTPDTIDMWGDLLSLVPEVQELVKAGKVGAKAASKFASVPREAQLAAVLAAIADGTATADKAPAAARAARQRAAVSDGGEGGEGGGEGGNGSDAPPAIERPSLDLLRKVAKSASKGNGPVSAEVQAVLAWVLGAGLPEDIEGLPAAIAAIPKRAPKAVAPVVPRANGTPAHESAEDLAD
jgi:hypothetical protein